MLADSLSSHGRTDVLIYLDNPQVASRIGSVLSVAAVSSSGMHGGFELNGCQVVVTLTAMIGQVRALLKLPVVNLEAFIFERPDHMSEGASKQFDSPAFLKRVLAVMSDAERRAPH